MDEEFDNCPYCRKRIKSIESSYSTKKALGYFKIKCLNQYCGEQISYEKYIDHLEKCPYRLYKCANNDCN